MTNKEFDKWLRESLSIQPEFHPTDWDDFVHDVEKSESQLDTGFDDAIRNAVDNVPVGMTPDWQRMEGLLETDETGFDDHVRDSIEKFEVPYNPTTWPTLHARLSEEERLRRRLVHIKVLELVAILIVFFTFYNFFPTLKSSVIKPAENLLRRELKVGVDSEPITAAPALEETHAIQENLAPAHQAAFSSSSSTFAPTTHKTTSFAFQNLQDSQQPGSSIISQDESISLFSMASVDIDRLQNDSRQPSTSDMPDGSLSNTEESHSTHSELSALMLAGLSSSALVAGPSASLSSRALVLPVLSKTDIRFGMMAAADVNTLFFPEEHFYSQGRSIRFSEKEIVAGGYSAGASLLFDFKRVMIETGLMYSTKNFGPDRNLFIGTSSDRHTLDFENITLNIVSLPLYLHLKVDGRGRWRVYATGGASMHLIANAHYDLIAENEFSSAAAPQNQQLLNQREVQRVREHMLDGAKFSSKGYLTAAGGVGVERFVNPRMTIFAQPMYQYQIPFFGLIDPNGKHLQNGSILLGTRISL